MALRERIEVGEVNAVRGGAHLQVQILHIYEESTRAGVREITREPWRFTVDREINLGGIEPPEGGWSDADLAPPMERLEQHLKMMPEGWPALDDDALAHIKRMAQAAWGEG